MLDAHVALDPFPFAEPSEPVRSQSERGDQHAQPYVSACGQHTQQQHVGTERNDRRGDERAGEQADVSQIKQPFHAVCLTDWTIRVHYRM